MPVFWFICTFRVGTNRVTKFKEKKFKILASKGVFAVSPSLGKTQ